MVDYKSCFRLAPWAFAFGWTSLFVGCDVREGTRIEHFRSGGSYFGGAAFPTRTGDALLYSSPRSGNGDIYKMSIDGTMTVRLTNHSDYDGDASYSFDGRRIVYVREGRAGSHVWIMDSVGGDQRQLTTEPGAVGGPRFSPDGSQVVFWRTDPELARRVGPAAARELYLIDSATGKETRLTTNESEDVYPAFSPDGNRIAFTREADTWLIGVDAANENRVAIGVQASFSPDGENLAVVGGRFGRQIDVLQVDGMERRTIYSENTTVSHPIFLPSGSAVVFLELTESRRAGDIVLVSFDGHEVRRITRTE